MNTEPIFMLVYTSRAVKPITYEVVKDILLISVKYNFRDRITGFLVARDQHFLQLLEGPETAVRECYRRICRDSRHTSIVTQGEATATHRIMPDWSMAWLEADEVNRSEDLVALFETGNAGRPYSDPQTLESMVRLFSKRAKRIDP